MSGVEVKACTGVKDLQPQGVKSNFNYNERVYVWVKLTPAYQDKIKCQPRSNLQSIAPVYQRIPGAGDGNIWNWYVVFFYFDGLPEGNITFEISGEEMSYGGVTVSVGSAPSTPDNDLYPVPPDYTPAPPADYTPAPPPSAANNAYQIAVTFPTALDYLEIPLAVESKFRALGLKFGWFVHSAYVYGGKLYIDIEKRGSIPIGTLLLILGAVIAAVLALRIVQITVTQLGTAYSETVQSNNIKDSVSKVIDYCNQYGISSEECNELINGVQQVYSTNEVQQPDNNTGAAWGAGALVLGLIALAALSKK